MSYYSLKTIKAFKKDNFFLKKVLKNVDSVKYVFIILLEHLVETSKKRFKIFKNFLTKKLKGFKIIIEIKFFEICKKVW